MRDDNNWKRIAELYEYEFESDQKLIITVSENIKTGVRLLDIRQWWRRKGEAEWHPSKRGLAMPVEEWWTIAAVIQTWLDDNT